jgi:hypothetical protein
MSFLLLLLAASVPPTPSPTPAVPMLGGRVGGFWGREEVERASGFASAREGGSGGSRPRRSGWVVAGPPYR